MTRCLKEKKKKARVEGGVETVGGSEKVGSTKKCETKMKREGGERGGNRALKWGMGAGFGDIYFKKIFWVKIHMNT